MTPEHALVQLLKLESLNIDGIKLYTGWTHEKATDTIEKCKASGAIAWKHKPSRYEVPAVPDKKRIADLQRLSADMHKMRLGRHQGLAANEHRQSGKESETDGVVNALGRVWA